MASKELKRSRNNKWIAGVCGGLAEYFGVDPMIIRLVWIVGTIFTGWIWGVLIYIVFIFAIKQD